MTSGRIGSLATVHPDGLGLIRDVGQVNLTTVISGYAHHSR